MSDLDTTARGLGSSALAVVRPTGLVQAQVIPLSTAQDLTFRAVIPAFLRWVRRVRRRSENTITAYGFDLRSFVTFCEGLDLTRPRDLTWRHVEGYLTWLQDRGAAPTTANRHLNAIRQVYKYLTREGVVGTNPAADVFSLKEPERLPRYLTVPEQERILREMALDRSLCGRRDYALVALMLFTGLRVEEVTGLRVTDLDLDAGKIRVEEGKGKKGRELPVVPRLAAILGDYLHAVRPRLVQRPRGYLHRDGQDRWEAQWFEDGRMRRARLRAASEAEARQQLEELAPLPPEPPWLFVNASPSQSHRLRRAGEPLLTRSIFHIVRRQVASRVGRPVSPHTLRHSFASRLREAGAPLELIGEALGHRQLSSTMAYAHLSSTKRKMELTRFLEAEA